MLTSLIEFILRATLPKGNPMVSSRKGITENSNASRVWKGEKLAKVPFVKRRSS
jgi:hypothetical protein